MIEDNFVCINSKGKIFLILKETSSGQTNSRYRWYAYLGNDGKVYEANYDYFYYHTSVLDS